MARAKVYYVQNQRNEVLDKNGGWTRLTSYSAAKFSDKDAATAAIPAGTPCQVIHRNEEVEA